MSPTQLGILFDVIHVHIHLKECSCHHYLGISLRAIELVDVEGIYPQPIILAVVAGLHEKVPKIALHVDYFVIQNHGMYRFVIAPSV